MNPTRIQTLQLFARVAELGSFSGAAQEAGLSQPHVSRQIGKLEGELGVQLLHRTTRTVALTAEGERYLDGVRAALDALDAAHDDIRRADAAPSGTLRLSIPVAFGQHHVAPTVHRYLGRFPSARVDVFLTDSFVDLVAERIDLAIRIGHMPDSTLRSSHLGHNPMVPVASLAYLDKRGAPRRPSELEGHACIVYSALPNPTRWSFQAPEQRPEAVTVRALCSFNHLLPIRDAVLANLGIAALPAWSISQDLEGGRLTRVLAPWVTANLPIQAVFPPGRHIPTRVRVFVEMLREDLIRSGAASETLGAHHDTVTDGR